MPAAQNSRAIAYVANTNVPGFSTGGEMAIRMVRRDSYLGSLFHIFRSTI